MDIDYGGPEFITWQVSKRVGTARYKATLAREDRPEVQAALADADAAWERARQILDEFRAGRLSRDEARSKLLKEHGIGASAAWDRIHPDIEPGRRGQCECRPRAARRPGPVLKEG